MGMDQQSLGKLSSDLNTLNRIMGMLSQPQTVNRRIDEAETDELDARQQAAEIQRQARQDAARLREDRERSRSQRNATMSRSNLKRNGSRQLVSDALRHQDESDEEDIRFMGEMEAQDTLNRARHAANRRRIHNGTTPERSTLSLGSKIYKYGG